MERVKNHMPNHSYVAAFVIGVILFAVFWKTLMGAASSTVILAGMAGAAVAVTAFWLRNEIQHRSKKEKHIGSNSI